MFHKPHGGISLFPIHTTCLLVVNYKNIDYDKKKKKVIKIRRKEKVEIDRPKGFQYLNQDTS